MCIFLLPYYGTVRSNDDIVFIHRTKNSILWDIYEFPELYPAQQHSQAHYRIIATVIYLVLTTLGKGLAGVGRAENFVLTPKFDLARQSEGNQNTSYAQKLYKTNTVSKEIKWSTIKAPKSEAYHNLKRLLCQQPLLSGVLNQYWIFRSKLCWQY